MGRRILVINQYFSPDVASSGQILKELCAGLVGNGHRVSVVAAQPSYESSEVNAPRFENVDGIDVYRINMSGTRGRSNLALRCIGYIRFLLVSWWLARKLMSQTGFDLVITLSNPPFAAVVGALTARRWDIPFLAVVYDIHPDIVRATQWINFPGWIFDLWNKIASWTLANATAIVVLGDGMKRTIIDTEGVAADVVNVIPIWAIPEFSEGQQPMPDTRNKFGITDDELVVLFAGNIGIMQPTNQVLDAAERILEMPVRFIFLGSGVGADSLSVSVKNRALKNVTVLPYQPFEEFQNLLLISDICLVTLKDGMERLSVPSRAYTFMSAGKPVIAMMNPEADVAQLVINGDCGWVIGDASKLASLLKELSENRDEATRKGLNAEEIYRKTLKKEKTIKRFSELIFEIT